MNHDLIKTGDADSFSAIEDRNGEVVLDYCRRCGCAEAELKAECLAVNKQDDNTWRVYVGEGSTNVKNTQIFKSSNGEYKAIYSLKHLQTLSDSNKKDRVHYCELGHPILTNFEGRDRVVTIDIDRICLVIKRFYFKQIDETILALYADVQPAGRFAENALMWLEGNLPHCRLLLRGVSTHESDLIESTCLWDLCHT